MRYLWILTFLAACFTARGQDSSLRVYRIISDTASTQYISPAYWERLSDNESKYSIEDVRGGLAAKFQNAVTEPSSGDTMARTQWMRVSIENVMATPAQISIASGSEHTDFYVTKADNGVEHFVTGWKHPWSKKDGLKKINAIPLEFAPGQSRTVYMRKQNKKLFHIPQIYEIPVYSTAKFVKKEFDEYQANAFDISFIYLSFFSGMLLLASIFNFLIYRSVKSRVNLYFSLFLLGMFTWYSPITRTILPRESPLVGDILQTFGAFWLLFLLFFIRHYFEVSKSFPRWDRFIQALAVVTCGFALGKLIFNAQGKLYDVAGIFLVSGFILSVLITMLIYVTKKGKHNRIFYIAVLPLIIYLTFTFLSSLVYQEYFSTVKWQNIFDYIGGCCILWAVIIFSKYLFEDYGKQQQEIVRVQVEKKQEQVQFMALQKIELEKQVKERTTELQQSVIELKATQSQLIQSEKMASLGELTAGIAHEIQNPLNFVNNFSEINTELISELKEEIDRGNFAEVKALADAVAENEGKINHHGKRADSIVKGMLQHSRSSSGVKEPTDINALADEFLRLAYHGLRAKDKSFNASLRTEFDNSIGNINVIPQDIGRVILNLLTNAFYAVSDKQKANPGGYEPTVSITTRLVENNIILTVTDNGNGIPQKVMDKIFQPFFTTKPTGEGTGLGLSMSYDIVTKGHGGEITVQNNEGEGATFIITLPKSP